MKSIFEQLMEQESFRDLATKVRYAGKVRGGPWQVEVPFAMKAIMTSPDFPVERRVELGPVPQRQVYVRDLVPVVGLDVAALSYNRVIQLSASAGGVAQASAKPETGVHIEVVNATADTIAGWLPSTREALNSAVGAAAWLNQVLRLILALAEDQAILNHNNTFFQGILNVSSINTQAVGADTRTDAVRKAITKVRQGMANVGSNPGIGFEPSAFLLNPADGEKLETQKDTAGGGYILLPAIVAPWWEPLQAQYWRVPVVETNAMPAGTGLLGAFDVGATLFQYGSVEVSVSDDHDDFLVKNKVAWRVEVRELLATWFPKAFCRITGL